MRRSLEKVSIEADIADYIREKRTGSQRPRTFEWRFLMACFTRQFPIPCFLSLLSYRTHWQLVLSTKTIENDMAQPGVPGPLELLCRFLNAALRQLYGSVKVLSFDMRRCTWLLFSASFYRNCLCSLLTVFQLIHDSIMISLLRS